MRKLIAKVQQANPIAKYIAAGVAFEIAAGIYVGTQTHYVQAMVSFALGWI